MVCSSCVRSLVVQAGTFAKRVKINSIGRSLQAVPSISYSPSREFKTITVMMVDTGSVSRRAGPLVDMVSEKDEDGRFASGGWKRWMWFTKLGFSNLCWLVQKYIVLMTLDGMEPLVCLDTMVNIPVGVKHL